MKKITKRFISLCLLIAMITALCGCGSNKLDMSKVKGDWTLTTINGLSVKDYAKAAKVDETICRVNITVTDKKYTSKNYAGEQSFDIDVKKNSFDVLNDKKEVYISVSYNKDKDTLSYSVAIDGSKYDYIFERGALPLK